MFKSCRGIQRRKVSVVFSAFMLAICCIAGSAPVLAEAPKTLRAVMHSALRSTDPIVTTAYITRNFGYMVYDTLLGTDENFEVRPQMADWSVSGDGLTYTFTLRDGLKWHDGKPVTAADCVASIRRWAAKDGMGQMLMDAAASLDAVDDRVIRLTLKEKVGFVLQALGKMSAYPAFMMPEDVAKTDPNTPIRSYTGSGPFRFVEEEFRPGIKAVFVKNADYVPREEPASWTAGGKVVKVDRVEWVVMPDPQMQINALRTGEIDLVENTPFDLLPLLKREDSIAIRGTDPLGFQIMGRMNFLHPPFDNVSVRRAALLALNQKDFLQALVGNPEYYKECGAIFVCNTPLETNVGARPVLADTIDEAREALKASGYDGTPVVLLQPTDVGVVKTHPVVAAQLLREAGFTVDAQSMDWQSVVSRRASQKKPSEGGWNMFFTIWNGSDLLNPLMNQAVNGAGTQGGWFGWPKDDRLQALRSAYARAATPEGQKNIATDIQAHVYDQVIAIPLGQFWTQTSWRKELSGVMDSPIPLFWEIEKR